MSRPYLVIDGYNFMHAAGLARRKYGPGQLQRCRTQLLRYLVLHLTSAERERTTIVFDAVSAPPDLSRSMHVAEMTVCFALPGKEADDMIEELIAVHSSPRQIRLVSGDHRLQRSARKRRGSFVDSDDFFDELERRGPVSTLDDQLDAPHLPEPFTGKGAPTDTDDWLQIFGDALKPEVAGMPDAELQSDTSIDQSDIAAIEKEVDEQDVKPRARKARRKR